MLAAGELERFAWAPYSRFLERVPVQPQLPRNASNRAEFQVLRAPIRDLAACPVTGFIHLRGEPPDRRGISRHPIRLNLRSISR
jgi:hypothetical protein